MAKADLITEVSTGVSGTYLEESNNLSDVASKDTSKLNLEVPDVGSSPNEVSLNGMLGSMAYQSAEAVSVDRLEVTDKMSVLESGNVSIGAGDVANNGSLHVYRSSATADLNLQSAGGSGRSYALQSLANGNLVVRDNNAAGDRLTIDSSGNVDVNTGDITQRESSTIYNKLDTDSSGLNITVNAGQANVTRNLIFKSSVSGGGVAERLRITSSALVLGSGMAIDFGSGASTTISDYEEGTWDGVYEPTTGSFAAITMDDDLVYTRIGNTVFVSGVIQTDNLDITGGSGQLKITGLPFSAAKASTATIGFAWNFGTAHPITAVVSASTIFFYTRSSTTSRTDDFDVSNMSTGASANRNTLYISATYTTS